MSIEIGNSDLADLFPIFFGIIIALAATAMIVSFFIRTQDNKKKLVSRKVKILEKPFQQGDTEYYVVECENGERLKLRSFQAGKIIIAVGDEGIIHYKGQTIQSFQRK